MFASDNPKKKPVKWESEFAWVGILIDYAGHFEGKYFLVVVDSYNKLLELPVVPGTDSKSTVRVFRRFYAIFGLPVEFASDNKTSFTSYEFREFL